MFRKLCKLSALMTALLSLALPAVPASAASASISLVANHSTIASGGTVIVAVYMNGGGNPINAVEADVSYPASELQYVGFSATGSAFEIGASSGGGGGTATLDRGTVSSVTGSGLVGTVTFRALVGSGSAAISVAGSSSLVSNGTAVPYGSSGTTIHFGVAAPSASSSHSAVSSPAPPPPKDTTPPTISGLKAKDITPFSATVTWTTSEPADSAVDFGVDANYGLSTSSSNKVTDHAVTLSSAFLSPEMLLHYRVKSADGSGNVTTGTDQTLQLPGVTVTVVVRSPDGKPQPNAVVTLDGTTGTTDSKGRVTLPSGLGNKKITTTYQGVVVQKPITIARSDKPLQPYQLDLSKQPANPWVTSTIGLIIVVLVLLGIDAVLFGSRFFARLIRLPMALPHPAPTTNRSVALEPSATRPVSDEAQSDAADTPLPVVPETDEASPEEAGESAIDPHKTVAELMENRPWPVSNHSTAEATAEQPPAGTHDAAAALAGLPSAPEFITPRQSSVTKIAVVDEPGALPAEITTTTQRLKKPAARSTTRKQPAKKTAKPSASKRSTRQ